MSEARPSFDVVEFETRVARLREVMTANSLSAFLIDDSEILAWVSGYESPVSLYRACIVPLTGPPVMVLRAFDVRPFLENAWFKAHRNYSDWEDPFVTVSEVFRSLALASARIGLDSASHALTVDGFRRIKSSLPDATFVELPNIPWELRLLKSAAEVERLARACAIADEAMRDIVAHARPGMTDREATAIAAQRFFELGADPGHPGLMTLGRGWDFLHGNLQNRPLEPGDLLHVELMPRVGGYSGRLMRSIAIGGSTAGQRATAETLIRLQDEQLAAMLPGVEGREVDAVLRKGLLREGLRTDYTNITGYTTGFCSKQPIRASDFTRVLHPHAEWRLAPGMIFHMYASAQGQAISETVHVGPHGPERLTRLERRLFEGTGSDHG